MSEIETPNKFPCAACGFLVFDEPAGSYAICPICDWEDDEVQLRFPALSGGANTKSLCEWQQRWLGKIPASFSEYKGYTRDPEWRPLLPKECEPSRAQPASGREYFDALTGLPVYYWK